MTKNTNRALRDRNADKTTVLLSHLRKALLLLQDTATSPTHSSYLQYNLALIRCNDVTRGLSQGDTQLKGAHWLTLRKQLRNNSKSGIERLQKNPKSPKHTPKNAINNIYLNQKNSKYQNTSRAGARFLHLAWEGGRFAPLSPVSYATDQTHFKHEKPQVLLLESHVTIGTIQQTQDAVSVL